MLAYGYGEGWCDDCEKIHWGLCPIWIDPIEHIPCNGPCNQSVDNCQCYLYCPECEQLWIDCDGHGAQYIQCSICKTCYWDDLGHNCTPPDPGGDDDDDGGDGDGDGGGTTPPTPDPKPTPNAKKIFRNSHMTDDNWERLERMLDKIIEDCMGQALYNGLVEKLNGNTLIIEFRPDWPSGNGQFKITESRVSIGDRGSGAESNTLFHEIFHVYQMYSETQTTVTTNLLNIEAEAHLAQYRYVKKLPEYQPGTTWQRYYSKDPVGLSTVLMDEHLNSKGELISLASTGEYKLDGDTVIFMSVLYNQQKKQHQEDGNTDTLPYLANPDRIGSMNFANLKVLSGEC